MPHIFGFQFGSTGALTKEQEEKIGGVPSGGTKGQVLTKKTNTSYDDEWATPTGGAPSGAAGGDLEGSEYPNPLIAAEKISSTKLATEAVTGTKIGTGAVIAAKLGAESVETAKIKLLAVTAGTLAAEAVETAKIKLLAVTAGTLAAEAVEEAKIKSSAVSAAKIASSAVETAKIKAEAVTTEKLSAEVQATLAAAKSFSHTWAIAGKVEAKEYPGFFVPANEPSLLKAEYELLKGTSCKFELLKNKEAIAEYTALEAVKTEKKTTTKTKTLTAGWWITLKVTEVTGTPEDLSITVSGE